MCLDINGQESGGWYEVEDGVLNDGYEPVVLAPELNAAGYTDKDSYACGFKGGSRSDGQDAMWELSIIFCHKYDTSVQSTLDTTGASGSMNKFSSQCPSSQFVTSVQIKSQGKQSCGQNNGVTGIKYRCSPLPGYSSGSHSSWTTAYEDGKGNWGEIYYHSTKLICGAGASHSSYQEFGCLIKDDLGVDRVKFKYCQVYDCRSTISSSTIPNQQYYVNHGNSYSSVSQYVYGERYIYYGWFNSFWQNTDTTNCPYTSCSLVGSTFEVALHTWGSNNNEMLKINQDPQSEYSVSLKVQCQNKEAVSLRNSNSFTITVSCSSNISIALPASFQQEQLGETTTVVASWNQFDFDSFETYTSACQLDYYEVYTSDTLLLTPIGIATNIYDEPQATGTLNQNQYAVKVLDGEKPYQYKFKIKAYVMGGNTFWTPELVLTTYCPSEVPVEPTSLLTTSLTTCKGADLIGTGDGARFSFPTYQPTLPMCQQVLGYSMINVSPSSSVLTYPSPTCNGQFCNTVDLDVSTSQTITFQIQVTTSINAGLSATTSLIAIEIADVCPELTITAPSVIGLANNNEIAAAEYRLLIGTGTQDFYFDLFTCSTGCAISYAVSPATTGLGVPVYNQDTNMMKISVVDTSLITYTFRIYGELQQQTTKNELTSEIKLSIVCGSEVITVSQSSLVLNPFDLVPSTTQTVLLNQVYSEFSSSSISSLFDSTVSLCPLLRFSLYQQVSTSTIWSDSSIVFTGDSPISQSYLTISIDSPFRKTVQIKGESQTGKFNYLSLDITVCGNEVLTSQPLDSSINKLVFDLNDVYSIEQSTYTYWFDLTNAEHPNCQEITYQLKQGINCDQSLDQYNLGRFSMSSSQKIEFNLSSPFDVQYLCLEASTRGQVKAIQILEVEVCGSEIISLVDDNKIIAITKLYNYETSSSQISLENEGLSFVSNRTNCPPYGYRLLKSDNSSYSGSQISSSGSISNIMINVARSTPLYHEILYLEVSSKNSPSFALLPLNISVCGYESLTSSPAREFYFSYDSSFQFIYKDFYENFFTVSHSECPIYSYEIVFNVTIQYNYQDITQRIMFDANEDIAIDTDVQEEHQEIMDKMQRKYGFVTDLKVVPFNLTAKSRGNVQVSQQLAAVFLSQDELEFLNQAPNFESDLWQQTILILEGNRDTQNQHLYQTPRIIDLEGDDIDYKISNLPSYMDCEFNETTGGLDFVFFKTAIVEKDLGQHQLPILLKDDSGKSMPRQVYLYYYLDYQKADLSLKSYQFQVPEECKPMSKITGVEMICPTSKQLFTDICQDTIIPSRIKSEETDEYSGYLQSVGVHFDMEIFKKRLASIYKLYAFTVDDFTQTVDELQVRFKGFSHNQEDSENPQECEFVSAMDEYNLGKDKIKKQIQKETQQFLVFINNALIFGEEDLAAISQTALKKEDKIVWPYISQVKFNKDLSMNVIISENLLVMKEEFNIQLNETILEIEIQSAIDSKVKFMGRRINNQSKETVGDYLEYLRDDNGYDQDEFLLLKDLAFEWDLFIYHENEMIVQIIPYYRKKLSLTPFGKDKIIFRMNPNNVVRSKNTGLTLEEQSLIERSFTFSIPPVFTDQESLEQGFNIAYNFAIALQASTFLLNIFLSKTLQDLWSLLNTISLIIHLPLIEMSVPGNAMFMMELMGQLIQKDMYPTDEIYGALFNFTEKGYPPSDEEPYEEVEFVPNTTQSRRLEAYESDLSPEIPTSGYDMLGYDDSNFIPLSGSGLINILIAIVSMIFYNSIRWFCRKLHQYQFARRIGLNFPKVNHFIGLVRFFFEGYMELLLSSLISVISLSEEDFSGNPSDTFSAVFAGISLLILLILPIYMIYIIKRNKSNLDCEDVTYNYGLFYQDLKTDNFYRSIFHVVFLTRRFIYVIITMFLSSHPNIQLMLLTKLSIVYLCYLLYWRPFSDQDLNDGEIFNELSIYLVQLSFLVMHGITEGKTQIGWCYIGVVTFNLGVNLMRIARVLVYEYIPDKYMQMLNKREERDYQNRKKHFLKEKEEMVKLFPHKRRYKVQLEITQITYKLQELEPKIKVLTRKINQEASWLISNEIAIGDILNSQLTFLDSLNIEHKKLTKRFHNRQKEFKKIVKRTRGEKFYQMVIQEIIKAEEEKKDQEEQKQNDEMLILTDEDEQLKEEVKSKLDQMVKLRFMEKKKQMIEKSQALQAENGSKHKKSKKAEEKKKSKKRSKPKKVRFEQETKQK